MRRPTRSAASSHGERAGRARRQQLTDEHAAADAPEPLVAARAAFAAAAFREAASLALDAAELARSAGRRDRLADAALLVEAVPDSSVAPVVERLCREAIDAAAADDDIGRARLHAQLAIALHHRERPQEAGTEIATAAHHLAAGGHDPLATVLALHARALAIGGSDAAGVLAVADELLAEAASTRVARHELLGRSWRIEALLPLGETGAARQEVDSLEVLAAVTRDPLIAWNYDLAAAGVDHAVGRFATAEAHARAARQALPAGQRHQSEAMFIAQAILIATDRAAAPPELDLARGTTVGGSLIAIAMTGRYDLELGDLAQARAAFELVRARVGDIGFDRRALPTIAAAAELAVAFGDAVLAAEMDARLAPYGGLMVASSLGAVGPIDHVRGRLAMLAGDRDAAVELADAAANLAARGGFAPWHARARLAHAQALVARGGAGDRRRAQESASLAVATARKLGMPRVAAAGEACLRDLDPRTRLSARELEVAGEIATGASNREIAATLGLSERTIESHVEHILAKLGIRSRAQVAAWVASQDAAPVTGPRPPER